jgi:phage-related protein
MPSKSLPRLEPAEKPLHWVGSPKRDLLDMPDPVVREIGIALSVAQFGSKHPNSNLGRVWVLECLRS